MSDATCTRVRAELALAEPCRSELARAHVASCATCRGEAVRLERLIVALSRDAEVEPSIELDLRLRRLIREAGPVRPLLRPLLATGLAVASFLALVGGLAVGLAAAGATDSGLQLAILAVSFYLAVSSAATLPLLLHRLSAARNEVQP